MQILYPQSPENKTSSRTFLIHFRSLNGVKLSFLKSFEPAFDRLNGPDGPYRPNGQNE